MSREPTEGETARTMLLAALAIGDGQMLDGFDLGHTAEMMYGKQADEVLAHLRRAGWSPPKPQEDQDDSLTCGDVSAVKGWGDCDREPGHTGPHTWPLIPPPLPVGVGGPPSQTDAAADDDWLVGGPRCPNHHVPEPCPTCHSYINAGL